MSTASTTNVETDVDAVTKAVQEAHKAAEELRAHPNSKPHIRARTMALVALVKAIEADLRAQGKPVTGAQTFAAERMECDRQLIHRHMRRAADRGWVESGWKRPRRKQPPKQTEFADVVDMETIGAPFLPPFSFRNESDIV